jgi:nucleoside-diphosphate-sugar epimerase
LVYVDDVIQATLAAIDRAATGVFNVGSGVESTALDVARTVLKLCQGDDRLLEIKSATGDGLLGFSALDVSRARRELDYAPRTLRSGIAAYLESLT